MSTWQEGREEVQEPVGAEEKSSKERESRETGEQRGADGGGNVDEELRTGGRSEQRSGEKREEEEEEEQPEGRTGTVKHYWTKEEVSDPPKRSRRRTPN